jgi:hypothetical protein
MHPFWNGTEQGLVEAFQKIREAIVDALIWFSDLCLEFFDWLTQVSVSRRLQNDLHAPSAACNVA